MRTGACLKRNEATSAKVNLPRLRSRSAIRNVITAIYVRRANSEYDDLTAEIAKAVLK
jgi:uncharacterized membrane protein (DUF485 family)